MTDSTEVKIFPTPREVGKAVAKEIKNLIKQADTGLLNIALSGGKTPEALFTALIEKYKNIIPWDKIHFWWADERCVPPDDIESNYNMARKLLFSHINIPPENIHRIKGEKDPEEEALRYSSEIKKHLPSARGMPVFDLIILGMGNDGHIASIFPDCLNLIDDQRICAATRHPATKMKRVTLTGSTIKNSKKIFFMVTGKGKASGVSEVMNNSTTAKLLPAYYIEPANGSMIWFLDETAASLIS